jgi:hypothetical protein
MTWGALFQNPVEKAVFTGWTCVSGPAVLVDFLVAHGEEVTSRQFARAVDVKTSPLDKVQIRMLPTDWSVTWLRTRLPSGEQAWVMQHSGIEHLYTLGGEFDQAAEVKLAEAWEDTQ